MTQQIYKGLIVGELYNLKYKIKFLKQAVAATNSLLTDVKVFRKEIYLKNQMATVGVNDFITLKITLLWKPEIF